jgi:hypothetical protein
MVTVVPEIESTGVIRVVHVRFARSSMRRWSGSVESQFRLEFRIVNPLALRAMSVGARLISARLARTPST